MLRFLVPLVLGGVSVLQAGMNRRTGAELGWPAAALLNNLVLFAVSVVFYLTQVRSGAALASQLPFRMSSSSAVYALPGLLGILLVLGIPWAISKWGATPVFVGLIVSQVLSSIWWDAAREGRGLGGAQLVGTVLSLGGALLMMAK